MRRHLRIRKRGNTQLDRRSCAPTITRPCLARSAAPIRSRAGRDQPPLLTAQAFTTSSGAAVLPRRHSLLIVVPEPVALVGLDGSQRRRIHLIEHDAGDTLTNARRLRKRLLHKASLGLSLFDDEYEAINETPDQLDVHDGHDWRNLNDNVVVGLSRSKQQLLHLCRSKQLGRIRNASRKSARQYMQPGALSFANERCQPRRILESFNQSLTCVWCQCSSQKPSMQISVDHQGAGS